MTPNTRVQRTRSSASPPPSPLTRGPLGGLEHREGRRDQNAEQAVEQVEAVSRRGSGSCTGEATPSNLPIRGGVANNARKLVAAGRCHHGRDGSRRVWAPHYVSIDRAGGDSYGREANIALRLRRCHAGARMVDMRIHVSATYVACRHGHRSNRREARMGIQSDEVDLATTWVKRGGCGAHALVRHALEVGCVQGSDVA